MARKFAAVVFSMGCLHASSTLALGLGELALDSFLNEPLKAKVDLLNTGGLHEDQIRIRLATKDDFKKMGVDRAYFLTNIKFEVDVDASGRGRIILTSEDPVLEPYLDFIVEARWPSGRLLREYTVLVDPPVFDSVNPVISASARVEAVEGIPAPAKKPSGAAAGSGTRVDVTKSDLAPGAMPGRDFNASAGGEPAPGGRYMIHRDDTLWKIALKAKPSGVSVHQAMLDIQRLNPNAFIDGNINRIKAGYIVYLPDSGDISSDNLEDAIAEVRQQNDDWREGVASQPAASSGPSLRISADPAETDTASADDVGDRAAASGVAAMENLEKADLEKAEMEERLSSMAQQVETLQRIVNLKDDQIAALQTALDEDGEAGDGLQGSAPAAQAASDLETPEEALEGTSPAPLDSGEEGAGESVTESGLQSALAPVEEETADQMAETPVEAAAATPEAAAEQSGGMMGYLKYIVGAAVAALLAVFFLRRRREEEEGEEILEAAIDDAPAEDVFANVELQEQELDLDQAESGDLAEEMQLADESPEFEENFEEEERTTRGYGGRKHDEYASDDAGDALAEADIYIAYGRYPQAMDLLRNAIANEPQNPAYRLKLLEMYVEIDDRDSAMGQLQELQSLGDADSVSRGEEILAGVGTLAGGSQVESALEDTVLEDTVLEDTELSLSEPDLTLDTGEELVADFAGLEIEPADSGETVAEELDLSADFETLEMASPSQDEDLVIAAEANGFSTKLDLARAYLDMGDEDGARQILQEVVAEGSDALKAEAQALLARID